MEILLLLRSICFSTIYGIYISAVSDLQVMFVGFRFKFNRFYFQILN